MMSFLFFYIIIFLRFGGVNIDRYFKVLRIALPAVGEMILFMLVWVIDTAFIGNWGGNDAVSAVGISSEMLSTLSGIFVTMGISVPITSMVAQKYGAGEFDESEKYLGQGILLGLIVAFVIFILIAFFNPFLLKLMGASGNVLENSLKYMKFAVFGVLFNMISSLLNSGLRGIGRTDISLISAIISNVLNIFLDWVFIFGKFGFPELGIMGSSLATFISFFTSFLFLIFYYNKYSYIKIRFKYIFTKNKNYITHLIKLAIPSGLQEGSFSVGRLLYVSFVLKGLGSISASANQIVTTVESISFMPGWGFGVAATSLVGQMVGAKKFDKAKDFANISVFMSAFVMGIFGLLFFIFPEFFIGLFINDTVTIAIGKDTLKIAAFEQIFMAISMVYAGSLKGYGDTKTPFKISLFTNWVLRLPVIYIFIFVLNLDLKWLWGVMVFQWMIDALLHFILFKKKTKSNLNII